MLVIALAIARVLEEIEWLPSLFLRIHPSRSLTSVKHTHPHIHTFIVLITFKSSRAFIVLRASPAFSYCMYTYTSTTLAKVDDREGKLV